jgi:GTPase SAR1 family protein
MASRVNMRPTNKNTLLKVVILGDGGVGKSCLMNRFVSNQFDEHSFHTIGVEFLNKDIEIDGETYTLQVSIHPSGGPSTLRLADLGHGGTGAIQDTPNALLPRQRHLHIDVRGRRQTQLSELADVEKRVPVLRRRQGERPVPVYSCGE